MARDVHWNRGCGAENQRATENTGHWGTPGSCSFFWNVLSRAPGRTGLASSSLRGNRKGCHGCLSGSLQPPLTSLWGLSQALSTSWVWASQPTCCCIRPMREQGQGWGRRGEGRVRLRRGSQDDLRIQMARAWPSLLRAESTWWPHCLPPRALGDPTFHVFPGDGSTAVTFVIFLFNSWSQHHCIYFSLS